MSKLLIVGTHSFDSGKTHFAADLGSVLIASGQSVEYFKPISGHNYWYHYEHTKYCLSIGQLVSRDATILKERLDLKTDITLINPIHSLFVPAKTERPLQNINGTLGLGGSSAILVMQRFSRPVDNRTESTILVADSLLKDERVIIGYDDVRKLSGNATQLPANSLQIFQEYEELHYEDIVTKSFLLIEGMSDSVIIESFNDATWPWDGLKNVDNVFAISPGHVFSYDPDRFRKASYLSKRSGLPIREVTFSRISDLIKPTSYVEIQPNKGLNSSQLEELGVG